MKRSAARIADNEDFADVTRKLQEAKERAGIILLSEIMKENEEAEREEAAKAEANETEDNIEGKVEDKVEGDASSEDAESDKDAAPAAAEEEEPEEPTIQRVEAIEILRDYVRLSRSSSRETLTAELRKPAPDEL